MTTTQTQEKRYSFYSDKGNGWGNKQVYTTVIDGVERIIRVSDDTAGSGNSQSYHFSVNGQYPDDLEPWDSHCGSADVFRLEEFLADGWLLRE
jgi:hypothetical protein